MKKFLLLMVTVIFAVTGAFAQIHKPVKWTVASKKLNNKEKIHLEIELKAKLRTEKKVKLKERKKVSSEKGKKWI